MESLASVARRRYEEGGRLVAPLVGFPGVGLIGSNIKTVQQNYGEHFKALKRLADEFHPDVLFPLMDLAVEANALGRYVVFPRDDSATVPKDEFRFEELERLCEITIAFDSRVNSYIETQKLMRIGLPSNIMRGAYVTGPYSLAALILGADDAALAVLMEPESFHRLCDFATRTIIEYARLLMAAGAQLICVLEPSAVMLGPEQFSEFSASYVRRIRAACEHNGVNTVYHTCGNTMQVAEKMVEAGVNGLSLDSHEAGVDLPAIAARIPSDVCLIGNVNPASTMLFGSPADVEREVDKLLESMEPYPNFVLSTGCDLPPETPPANIHAFMEAGRRYRLARRSVA